MERHQTARRTRSWTLDTACSSSSLSAVDPKSHFLRKATANTGRLPAAMLDAKLLPKPQLQFSSSLPRDRKTTFVPSIREKPNAATPLDLETQTIAGAYGSQDLMQRIPNPYGAEISAIPSNMPIELFREPSPPAPPPADSFQSVPFTFVDTSEGFTNLLTHLASAKEIAVDLEHHDYRSYHGIVCLMQISVPGHDFVVDVLVPEVRDRMAELNQTFTDPNIVKVFHGADSDIIWLQRDFAVYVVGLFDTFQASKLLGACEARLGAKLTPLGSAGYAKHSLAALLQRFVGFEADKRYQLADWRIRPIPAEMLYYARSDTHFLLYVYHALAHALWASKRDEGVKRVFELSTLTAGQAFSFPPYEPLTGTGPIGWRSIVHKWGKGTEYGVPPPPLNFALRPRSKTLLEFHIFRALHDWRDQVAREEDESPRFIMNHASLFKLAEKRPTNAAGVLTTVAPVSAPVANRRVALANLIRESTEAWEALSDDSTRSSIASTHAAPINAKKGPLGEVPPTLWQSGWLTVCDDAAQADRSFKGHATSLKAPTSQMLEATRYRLQVSASKLFGKSLGRAEVDAKFASVLDKVHSSLNLALSFAAVSLQA
jgi:exosome complex exonuclease RRP6